jgi:DNA-binding beta-propeller fold protein YncE
VIPRRAVLAGLGASALLPRRAVGGALPLPEWPGQVLEPVVVFECGPQPKGIAFHPSGAEVWVSFLDGPPSVGVYTLPNGELRASVTLGDKGAVEVELSADGHRAWASQMETATVYEIDVATGTELRAMSTGSNWSKVIEPSADGQRLYVSNWNFDDVSELDLATGALLRRLKTVTTPRGLYATRDGASLYVVGFGDGQVERITLTTGARHPVFTGGRALRHLVVDPAERFAYVTDMGARCVWRIELATGATTRWARTDANPNSCALSPDGRLLFVSNRGPNGKDGYMADGPAWGSLLVYDVETAAILDSVVGGDQCTGLDVSRDGSLVAFTDFRDDTVRVYRVPPLEALRAAKWPRREVHERDLWKRGG